MAMTQAPYPILSSLPRILAAMLLLACAQLNAGPAPWWQWQSLSDAKVTACSQTPLGPGWEKFRGPFKDSRCEKLVLVK